MLQLSLLGNDLTNKLQPLKAAPPVTGQLAIDDIDKKLKKLDADANLARLNWEVVPEDAEVAAEAKGAPKSVTFGFKTPDGVWELRKNTKSAAGRRRTRIATKIRSAINSRCS